MKSIKVETAKELYKTPGAYYFSEESQTWFVCTPNGHAGNLGNHDVTVNEDGTLTVSPSILVSNPQQGELWHGYIENGIWREC